MSSTAIKTKPLPHKVGTADIMNPELKRIAMLFMENFLSLDRRVVEIERVVGTTEKKGG